VILVGATVLCCLWFSPPADPLSVAACLRWVLDPERQARRRRDAEEFARLTREWLRSQGGKQGGKGGSPGSSPGEDEDEGDE